ncbi:MAG: arsenite efflux transporter metallochaperone ArsD [Vulcanimicrobiota bacterium]
MPTLQVFDPPMCCSTGVCGVNVDPQLTQLVADLNFLKQNGVAVERFNLKDNVKAFTDHPQVIAEMGAENEFLPIFMLDGKIICKGAYPSRQQLAKWAGVAADDGGCCSGGKCCG